MKNLFVHSGVSRFMANIFKLLILFAALSLATPVVSQETASETIQSDIAPTETKPTDAQIQSEINRIFGEIESLGRVDASVNAGVVTLSGITATADATARAENIAARVNGVVTVENEIERDVSVDSRLTPALEETRNYIADAIKFTPLFALALAVFALIAFVGWLLSGWRSLWRRATPNAFIAEIAATSIRLVFIVLAAIAALSLLDATALLGAFLGAAGVLGLAVGFAVRDTIENYIASIMLSLRQPFRPNDHVRIDDKEGRVIRLTSRATVLMTLDGNHLRIPNAAVFKAVILNYSRNEDRRFQFDLGVDADDDPLAAIDTGLDTIRALAFVLKEPAPAAFIKDVGDSNIVITFTAWIDQSQSDFMKSRSVALAAAKDALEEAGFALPEPIYRLRFDAASPPILKEAASATVSETSTASVAAQKKDLSAKSKRARADQALDTRPDTHIADKVEEERLETGEADLLDDDAPVE